MIFIKYSNSKCFLHKINIDILDDIVDQLKIGFLNNDDVFYDKIQENDFIIFSTDLNGENILFAFSNVKNISKDNIKLYNSYYSDKVINLKGIAFFPKPVLRDDCYLENDFQYMEISKSDFDSFKPKINDICMDKPFYLMNIDKITIKTFINNISIFLDDLIKNVSNMEVTHDNKELLLNKILLEYNLTRNEDFKYPVFKVKESSYDSGKQFLTEYIFKNDIEIKHTDYIFLLNDELCLFAVGYVDCYYYCYYYFNPWKYYIINFNKITYLGKPLCIEFNDNDNFEIITAHEENMIIEDEIYYLDEEFPINNIDEFIINSCKILFNLIQEVSDEHLIEINKFLILFKNYLENCGLNLSQDQLNNYFRLNAYKFGFSFESSRNPELLMEICHKKNKKSDFSHLVINKN